MHESGKGKSRMGMEDGGVDTTVINSRQQKMGQMADFPPLLASSVFDF
jgi:hypothetical protein